MEKILHKLLLEAFDIDNQLKKTSFYKRYPKFKSKGRVVDIVNIDWYRVNRIKDVIFNDEAFIGNVGSEEYYIYLYYKFLKGLCDKSIEKQATTSVNIEKGLSKIDNLLGDLGVSSQSLTKTSDTYDTEKYKNVNSVNLEDGMKLHIDYSYDGSNYKDEFVFDYDKNILVGNKNENIKLNSPFITTHKTYNVNVKRKNHRIEVPKNIIFNNIQVLDIKHTALGIECDMLADFKDFVKMISSIK